jgi:hypothetical protein
LKLAAVEPEPARRVDYRVGFLGAPCHPQVEWNDANLERLKSLGFNCIQLNIAWGYRPNDEPLNLEDVVALPAGVAPMPGDTDRAPSRTPEKVAARSAELTKRIALCRKHGLRTIFHFGAPNVFYPPQDPDKPLDLCIADPATVERYRLLVRAFHEKFPGVDDLLCYTYDQHAWLCSEWGPCPRCHGIPLHERVTAFVNMMARTWRGLQKDGVLFWEPWELSAGETFRCMDDLDASCVGLALHSNIAEVQIAIPADRWFRNAVGKAARLGLPVLGEVWLGGATEEMEPYIHVPTPLATLRALRAVNTSGPLKGIKEYYGLVPDREDPNLRMTGIFFADPDISDEVALARLAEPYGPAAAKVADYWKLVSTAVEIYPWDVSWLSREVGKSDPAHLLSAATLKGASWQTPSWQSTRRGLFIRTDQTTQPLAPRGCPAALRTDSDAPRRSPRRGRRGTPGCAGGARRGVRQVGRGGDGAAATRPRLCLPSSGDESRRHDSKRGEGGERERRANVEGAARGDGPRPGEHGNGRAPRRRHCPARRRPAGVPRHLLPSHGGDREEGRVDDHVGVTGGELPPDRFTGSSALRA